MRHILTFSLLLLHLCTIAQQPAFGTYGTDPAPSPPTSAYTGDSTTADPAPSPSPTTLIIGGIISLLATVSAGYFSYKGSRAAADAAAAKDADRKDEERKASQDQGKSIAEALKFMQERVMAQGLTLDGILKQTTATNGRVTKAQEDIHSLDKAHSATAAEIRGLEKRLTTLEEEARNKR
jgi:hypothetical protein